MDNSLSPASPHIITPYLILIRGLPGSGKSYLAHALRTALGEADVVLLDPDATDYASPDYVAMSQELTEQGVDAKFHPYRWLRSQAYAGITTGKVIIWNQAFTNLDGFNKTVINLQNFAAEQTVNLPVLVVEVEISHEAAKKRVADRAGQGGHNVSAEEFDRFINDYRSFASEGYHVMSVNGESDVTESVDRILTALRA